VHYIIIICKKYNSSFYITSFRLLRENDDYEVNIKNIYLFFVHARFNTTGFVSSESSASSSAYV